MRKMGRAEVGLTGGIGCGKSEVARILEKDGIPVLDTDEVAHALMAPGETTYESVVGAFGDSILGKDGRIDRKVLGARVFGNASERKFLNSLVHPEVRRYWQSWVDERRAQDDSAVVVIPLLFETGATRGWTAIVCVTAEDQLVRERLKSRGLSAEQAEQRIAAQMQVEEKASRADYVIENSGTLEELAHRVRTTWTAIADKE